MHSRRTRRTWTVCIAALALASSAKAQSQADPKPAPPVASSPPVAAAVSTPADWVELSIVTDEPRLGLYAREPRKVTVDDTMGDSWAFVCDAPCGVRIDPRRTYRVMGESIVPSIHFNLAPGSGHVALQVHPSRPSSRTVGAVLATTGAVVVFAGALFFLVDAVLHSVGDGIASESAVAQSELDDSADSYRNVGIGLVAGGAALGVTSLFFLLAGKTGLSPADPGRSRTNADGASGIHAIPFGFAF